MATAKTAALQDASPTKTGEQEDVETHVARVREDIAALAKSVQAYGASKKGEYRARASKASDDLTAASQDALEQIQREFANMEREVSGHIRQRPLQSIGIAAGVGFLIAMLVRR